MIRERASMLRYTYTICLVSSPNRSARHLGSPNLLIGHRCFSPGVKRQGLEIRHTPPSNAKVKNEWNCASVPPVCLHGVDRDQLTLTLMVNLRGYVD